MTERMSEPGERRDDEAGDEKEREREKERKGRREGEEEADEMEECQGKRQEMLGLPGLSQQPRRRDETSTRMGG